MHQRVTDQAAFILHRRDWQNTSLILDVFSLNFGRVSLIAKAAKRSRSCGLYQPFTLLSLGWSGRQSLKTLIGIDGQQIEINSQNYLALLYINELISLFLPPEEANQQLFSHYLDLLNSSSTRLAESLLREFELTMMTNLGYFPDISLDSISGDAISSDAYYQFQINQGFIACQKLSTNSITGQLILDWLEKDYQQPNVLRLAKSVLRSTIDFNLHGKKLKSRDVYMQIRNRA